MQVALQILGVVSLVELTLWLAPFWRWRKGLAYILAGVLSVGNGALLWANLSVWAVLIALLSVYRLVNLLRIICNRIHLDYLWHTARLTSLWLISVQTAIVMLYLLANHNHTNILSYFYLLAVAQLLAGSILMGTTIRSNIKTHPSNDFGGLANRDLLSLTVAIPARNETEELEQCLESLLSSNYPKLEILVLDDCSQNKRTPEIIRNFAQRGVRFMAGSAPPESWLAKNYAYDQLAAGANGSLILFCGVDARFEPHSLTAIVKTMLQRKKTMLSVMPRNLRQGSGPAGLMIQPSRYAWEICIPRRLLNRPPVLSTCWMITKDALKTAGGFDAARRSILPEAYLAREAAKNNDGYSFVQADKVLGVSTQKTVTEQHDTAVRTRYPQLHRRPEVVCLVGLAELSLLFWPLVMFAVALLTGVWPLAVLCGLAYLLYGINYFAVTAITYQRPVWSSLLLFPVAVIYDLWLLNYSMWQYEFHEVLWKGRNVCLPLMRITPNLPKLN